MRKTGIRLERTATHVGMNVDNVDVGCKYSISFFMTVIIKQIADLC